MWTQGVDTYCWYVQDMVSQVHQYSWYM